MSEQFPQVSIPDTQMRKLASSSTRYEYHIHIALPAGYAGGDKTYPTLYVLDPHLTFGMSAEITRLLAFGQELPQLICVGIGFTGPEKDIESYQVRDYVPKAQVDEPRSGGAENFLRFIREDLIPFVDAEYRVDPKDKCFLGYSLAGLFGLYTLFHHPDTFQRYLISSPWMDPDDLQVFSFETEYATTHSDLTAQVFIGAGSLELEFVVANIQKLEKALQNRNYPNLRLETYMFEGETHLSVVPQSISRGLKIVYE
jgi:predicted alpha/beta superfamily hydrolase